MIYKADNVKINIDDLTKTKPREAVIKKLQLDETKVKDFQITKQSLDSRFHKSRGIFYVFNVRFSYDGKIRHANVAPASIDNNSFIVSPIKNNVQPVVIVGSGPAGLFAALRLIDYGISPILIEKGKDLTERSADIKQFFDNRELLPDSNIQFGLGGAGTYSDGKLMSRSKSKLSAYVLEKFIKFGADSSIRYFAKPHLGTDKLRKIISLMKDFILENGGIIKFNSNMSGITTHKEGINSIIVNNNEEIECSDLIVAPGNAARGTFEMLHDCGIAMAPKSFAVGVRIEHNQSTIDKYIYGKYASSSILPSAEYQLTYSDHENNRSVYSFCNCPGGLVINSATEEGGIATNGMSYSKRSLNNANSAIVVSINENDLSGTSPLRGIEFQRKIEQAAFKLAGSNYNAPVMSVADFIGINSSSEVSPTILPGSTYTDINKCLPDFISKSLKNAINEFCINIDGFSEGIITAPETRTSSPVRILRKNDTLESINCTGLYPAGEGSGYAGGIMSSAIDGVRAADSIAQKYSSEDCNE